MIEASKLIDLYPQPPMRVVPFFVFLFTNIPLLEINSIVLASPLQNAKLDIEQPYLLSQTLPSDTLQLEDTGNAVAGLQTQLATLGYYQGPISGVFGPLTQDAVIRFQDANGLIPDGLVGSQTQAIIQQLLNQRVQRATTVSSTTPDATDELLLLNDQGDRVRTLQTRLAELGYYQRSITGVFDASTEAAVIQFQQDQGLITDGIVGPQTQTALAQSSLSQASRLPSLPPAQPTLQPLSPPLISPELPPSDPLAPTVTVPSLSPQATQPLSTPTSSTGVLRRGDRGPAVAALQQGLRDFGFYNGTISGEFDARTEEAVQAFQRSRGLTVDGVVGAQTASALRLQNTASTPGGRFSVLDLQRRLQNRGFYTGPLDGILSPETRSAIQAAQRQFNLSENDIVDGRF